VQAECQHDVDDQTIASAARSNTLRPDTSMRRVAPKIEDGERR
jgi:hypothetical protein